jgi:hypothetical protein
MAEQFENLEATLPSQNSINEEIRTNESRECPLSLAAEFFFQSAIQKY